MHRWVDPLFLLSLKPKTNSHTVCVFFLEITQNCTVQISSLILISRNRCSVNKQTLQWNCHICGTVLKTSYGHEIKSPHFLRLRNVLQQGIQVQHAIVLDIVLLEEKGNSVAIPARFFTFQPPPPPLAAPQQASLLKPPALCWMSDILVSFGQHIV